MAEHIQIFEMGPRDGLQNQKRIISLADKIRLVDMLSDCGFEKIEVASFVSPKWVPQMADSDQVLAGITRREGVVYSALAPNMRGYEAAVLAGADEVAIFASASEGFSQANINCSIKESIVRFRPILAAAKADNIPVRGYISCVIECPYDGVTEPQKVAELAALLMEAGCYAVSLGDTIGAGAPDTVKQMLAAVLAMVPASDLAGHFHDTHGRALDNIGTSLDMGLRVFDAAVGGLGGCPFAPGAAGNVDTVSVVDMLHQRGFETGLDVDKLVRSAAFAVELKG
ncbi:MAG: hydroxymethylglutaryl-CoA lyase [Rhodobacteraceae bacterium]|nr:hydroxymethylglutaryl-CoA lyase [Paracoccaceae bacterium]